jgi:hypothetical protein
MSTDDPIAPVSPVASTPPSGGSDLVDSPAGYSGDVPADRSGDKGGLRSRTGQFLPGEKWDGNAKGRAKGVKNRITLERLLLEEKLRNKLGFKAEDLLAKAIEMAMGGDDKIMRTLLDKLLATPKNSEDGDAKDNTVNVVINDLSGSANPRPVATISKGSQSLDFPRVTTTINGDSDK